MTDFEVFNKICNNRKSTRKFSEKAVDKELINKIISTAKTSPYASGLSNWEITVIDKKETIIDLINAVKQKVEEIGNEIRDDLKEPFLNYSKSFYFFEMAPVLLIFTFRVSPVITAMLGDKITPEFRQWERDNFTKSISCAVTIALLAAESLGLGACYMTGPLLAFENIGKTIKIKPGREIAAIVPIGYAK